MHHFIFPSQDTYITNRPHELDTKNFGVDEILQVGTDNSREGYISSTTDYTYVNAVFIHQGVQDFTGQFTGSITGTSGSSVAILSGSVTGYFTSSFSASNFTGSITHGQIICLYGTASGVDTRQQRSRQYRTSSYIDRALLKFDLTAISASIATGSIVNPSFHLKIKICNEYQLPIDYMIYAAPISESWEMGNGYASDGGSDEGASWVYRDYDGGTPWAVTGSSFVPIYCTQSFRYKSADLDMDVTPIVNLWLNGTVPNNGFLVMSSDEFHPTGSGFLLKYFSEDTNTIYSPVLDVGWSSDWEFTTGSYATASVVISYSSGSSTTVTDGSSLTGAGGIHGNFKGAAFLSIFPHYLTASNARFTGSFVQQFTGSFSGSFYGFALDSYGIFTGSGAFTASYFLGLLDGNPSVISNSVVSASNIQGLLTSSISMPSYLGTFSGSLQGSALALYGTADGYYLDESNYRFTGFISASGLTGNINGIPVIGPSEGLISAGNVIINLPSEIKTSCATSPMESPYGTPNFPATTNPYTYLNLEWVWGGDEVGWSSLIPITPNSCVTSSCGVSHSVQLMAGSFTGGPFGGATFTAYYENYQILYAWLTGSWNSASLIGASVIIPMPQASYPYVTAYIRGTYVNGTALGIYTVSSSISQSIATSASFDGQFIDGPLLGGHIRLQLSGSASTSSYAYTSSVNFTSSLLSPLDVERPFSINVSNLQPEYKVGDIIKIGVFGRKKFPLKYFGISTQQEQYLVSEFLPVTSYYALKDNQTDEIVVNFDSYTQISCEYPGGNYFMIDTTALPQERYYRVLIRVEDGNQIDTIDTGKTFKITR